MPKAAAGGDPARLEHAEDGWVRILAVVAPVARRRWAEGRLLHDGKRRCAYRAALHAGANEYIMKPFDKEIVEAKFQEVGLI